MNVALIIRRALLDANVVKTDSTSTPILTQNEMLSWVEDGTTLVEEALRNARVDYAVKFITSDGTNFIWDGQLFTVSGLQISSATLTYTLPPDLLRLKRFRITSTSQTDLRLRHMDMSDDLFIDTEAQVDATGSGPQRWEILWDIFGDRYIRIPNAPETAIETELVYVARSRKPYIETGGTDVAVTLGDATVTGNATTWLANERYYPAEIMFESSGGTSSPVTLTQTSTDDIITPQTRAWPLAENVPGTPIASETTFELATVYTPATDANIGYMLASVPLVPVEHHKMIVEYVVYRIQKKLGSMQSQQSFMDFKDKLDSFRQDITPRQDADFEYVDDFDFGDY